MVNDDLAHLKSRMGGASLNLWEGGGQNGNITLNNRH